MPSRFWKASGNALLPGCNTLSTAGGLGPEIVINGDFSVGTGWNLSGASISGGVLNASAATGFGTWQTNAGIVSGHNYRVVFDITAYTSGSVQPYIGSAGTGLTSRSAAGTWSVDAVADSSNELGFFFASFTGIIDNFSVKEIL